MRRVILVVSLSILAFYPTPVASQESKVAAKAKKPAAETIAPEDVTKWEVGNVFQFPPQDEQKYFEVSKLYDKEGFTVKGVQLGREPKIVRGQAVPGDVVQLAWYPVFMVKKDPGELVNGKRITLEGKYKVTGTKTLKSALGSKKTVYVVEEAVAQIKKP